MSIRALASGRFQARLMIGGRTFTRSFDTRAEAADWELTTRAQAITTGLPLRSTVAEYAARWTGTFAEAPTATRTFHEGNLRRHILPALGKRLVGDVTPTDIAGLINSVRASVSTATADAVYRTSSALFNAAAADDLIARSPVKSKRHRPRRQAEPPTVLERPQAQALLRELDGWQRDASLLQLSFGARIGEIAGLTPHDVDLDKSTATIRRRFYRDTVRATKNHRLRTLDIPRAAQVTIERLIEVAGPVEPIPPLGDREVDASPFHRRWLVQTATGRPANYSALNKALAEAAARVDVPRLSSHDLRHTYVSWMIDDGHSAEKIAFWIGDTPQTVQQVYAHMLEASSAPAAASIDAALGNLHQG